MCVCVFQKLVWTLIRLRSETLGRLGCDGRVRKLNSAAVPFEQEYAVMRYRWPVSDHTLYHKDLYNTLTLVYVLCFPLCVCFCPLNEKHSISAAPPVLVQIIQFESRVTQSVSSPWSHPLKQIQAIFSSCGHGKNMCDFELCHRMIRTTTWPQCIDPYVVKVILFLNIKWCNHYVKPLYTQLITSILERPKMF